MRYEHIETDLSTLDCAYLLERIDSDKDKPLTAGILLLRNNLFARLQRRDVDPHCPLNNPGEDWLSC